MGSSSFVGKLHEFTGLHSRLNLDRTNEKKKQKQMDAADDIKLKFHQLQPKSKVEQDTFLHFANISS